MMQSVLTSFTPLKNKNELNCWENQPFSSVWPEIVQQSKKDVPRKTKKKRARTAFTTHQLLMLENSFFLNKYINSTERAEIAKTLNISEKCIKVWFQNRRMKEKRELSESSCDSLSDPVSIESPSVPASQPFQVDVSTTQQISHYPDSTYQLPTYCNTNKLQSTYESTSPCDFATYFHSEQTVYPTQYYPHNINYSKEENNGYNQYISEVNNYWAESQYTYYTTA